MERGERRMRGATKRRGGMAGTGKMRGGRRDGGGEGWVRSTAGR